MGSMTAYFDAAMRNVRVEQRSDGLWYAWIPICKGVWAAEVTREQALRVVREVLEEWVLVGIWHHMTLPSIEGASLTVVCEDEHANKG